MAITLDKHAQEAEHAPVTDGDGWEPLVPWTLPRLERHNDLRDLAYAFHVHAIATRSAEPSTVPATVVVDAVDDIMVDAVDWTRDCHGDLDMHVSSEDAWRYVDRHYPGGWDSFVQDMAVRVRL